MEVQDSLDSPGSPKKTHFSPSLVTRYFTPGPARRKVITRQYLNRVAEKRARQAAQAHPDERFAAFDPVHTVAAAQRVAAHLVLRDGADESYGRVAHRRRAWHHDVKEGRDLARSQVPLPYSGQGPIRRPTLEREEAFWDPTTCKRARTCSMEDSTISVVDDEADPETAQLYRMGLLYDDEYTRGSGFTLNTILHDEPEFTIRPAKRRRKTARTSAAGTPDFSFPQNGLSLHLSFAQLHKDEMIAQYLISPSPSEFNPADWEEASAHTTPSEAFASVHSLNTDDYFPCMTQDTQMTNDSCSAAKVPDLVPSRDCLADDDENPQTTQTPDFDCDSDTTSLSGSDADLVILPLHLSREEDERTRQSATPRRASLDAVAASWIMLGDDS
jgi:hypothetical protein